MDDIGMDLARAGLTRREALAGIGGTMLVAAAPPVFAASAIAHLQPLRATPRVRRPSTILRAYEI